MGCWGITAFESDDGLDAVNLIRKNLPIDGKLELKELIEFLQQDEWNKPSDVENGLAHTSPMALAEIMVKFIDDDISELDYEEEWASEDNKFRSITSFSASKESIEWVKNYISDTLRYAKVNSDKMYNLWGGWFEEENWILWQEHMENLVNRLNTLLDAPEDCINLCQHQDTMENKEAGSRFLTLEEVCATTPDKHHYLIVHAQDMDSGKTVWAIGDDQVCAIASEDFIRNKKVNYNDVCIQEFAYHDYTPESVGSWRSLIEELVKFTLQKYMEHDGLVHVYPQWIPEDLHSLMGKELFEEIIQSTDHIILYPDNRMDFVPLSSTIEGIYDEPELNI